MSKQSQRNRNTHQQSSPRNRLKTRLKLSPGNSGHGTRGTIAFAGKSVAAPAPLVAPVLCLAARLYGAMRQSLLRFVHPLLKRRNRRRKLELMEMQQLGEKRFVAIVRVGKQKFLIGGAASSISLLAEIGSIKTTILTPRPLHQELA
jgi:hypothetical protein